MLDVDVELRRGDFELDCRLANTGRVTGLFGPSGAGKSTLLRILAGLETPDAGRVEIAGTRLFDSERRIDIAPHQRGLGVVFQQAHLFPHLNVRHNLAYGAWFAGRRRRAAAFDRVVAMLDIGALLARRVAGLSGGERQRVAIGRALMAEPKALLLDEPLASLDAARKREVLPYIERLSVETDLPIVFVTHQLNELLRLARHQVAVIDGGRIRFCGSTAAFLARPDLLGTDQAAGAGTLLAARVAAHRPDDGLSVLDCGGQPLFVPRVDHALGAEIVVHVQARDVMLARREPVDISALNQLAGRIDAIEPDADGYGASVVLGIGDQRLEARITRYSLRRLALSVGQPVHAVVKSLALAEQAWQPVAEV